MLWNLFEKLGDTYIYYITMVINWRLVGENQPTEPSNRVRDWIPEL